MKLLNAALFLASILAQFSSPAHAQSASEADRLGKAVIAFDESVVRQAIVQNLHHIAAFPETKHTCVNMETDMNPVSPNFHPHIQTKEEADAEAAILAEIDKKTPAMLDVIQKENPNFQADMTEIAEAVFKEVPELLKKDAGPDEASKKAFEEENDKFIASLSQRAAILEKVLQSETEITPADALELQKLMMLKPRVMAVPFPKQSNFDADCNIESAQYEAGVKFRAAIEK